MKKLFFLALVLCSLKGFSQYPTGQTIGADSTLVTSKGGLKGRIINWTYTDTAAANLQRIKQYPGAQIFTTSNESFWLRNSTATAWIGVSGGGGGGPGVTVTSYGKNITGDSSILLLSDGTRYAALDSVGSGTSTINIITDSSISICTGTNSCDTIIINTVSVNNVTILNDSTLVVCDSLFACDTIHINPSPFGSQGLQQVIDVNPDLNKNDTIRTFATLLSISSLTNGTDDLKAGLNIIRQTTGTAADGIGSTLDFSTQASDGNIYKSNQISSSWDTANAVNRTSKFAIRGLSNAQPSEDLLTVKGTGQIIANKYGLGTFTGTPTYAIYEDAAGHFIEVIPPIPPTLTATYPIIYNNVTGDISADTTTALTGLATHFYADSAFVRTRNVAVDTLRLYRKNGDSTDVLFDLLAYGVTSYGKNATGDSTVLVAGGVRYPAKDSIGAGTVTGGAIAWPGTIYNTPTTGVVSTGIITFTPTLVAQAPYTLFGNLTGSTATPTFSTNNFSDSLRRVGVNVARRVNGTWINQFTDSVGGAGTTIDSIRKKGVRFDSIVQYSGGTGTFDFRIPQYFNVKDYGARADGSTDNTTAFQNAINAAVAAGGGTIYIPYDTNTYKISGALQTSVSGKNPNCQLYIPLITQITKEVDITFEGASPTNFISSAAGTAQNTQGVIIESTIQGTGTVPSVIGSPWFTHSSFGFRNWVHVHFNNVSIRTSTTQGGLDSVGTMSAINGSRFMGMTTRNLKVDVSSTLANMHVPTAETFGVIFPSMSNNASLSSDGFFIVEGYKYGVVAEEHWEAANFTAIYCVNGIVADSACASVHVNTFLTEGCVNNFLMRGNANVVVDQFQTEHYVIGRFLHAYDVKFETPPTSAIFSDPTLLYPISNRSIRIEHFSQTSPSVGVQNFFVTNDSTHVFLKSIADLDLDESIQYPSSAATQNINLLNGSKAYFTLTANTTVNFTKSFFGKEVNLYVKQDATGSRTLTVMGTTIAITPTANALTKVTCTNTANGWVINTSGDGSVSSQWISTIDGVSLTGSGTGSPYVYLNSTNATNANRYNGIVYQNNSTIQWVTGLRNGDGLYHVYDAVNSADRLTVSTTGVSARMIPRYGSATSSATPTINTDLYDTYALTAQAADITSFTTNLTGTPVTDQVLHIIITGTAARAITWGASFEASTVALPTTTVTTNRLDVYFVWNAVTSKWRCGGVW